MTDRQNLDGILVANELVDFRMKSRVKGFILKIDLEKAYDHTNWGFTLQTLEQMNFGAKLRE